MAKPFNVVYEDNHLIIVNKAAGILVQGDQTGDKTLSDYVKEYISVKYNKPGAVFLGTVHRLDRPVSGLVVFARTSKGLERMNELFRRRDIQKTYWAVVGKKPEQKSGKLTHWLVKDEARNVVTAYDYERPGSQKAELTYKLIGEMNHHFLLEVNPVTGRPHQIRVQLASMGCPIRGDLKYGYPRPNPDASINLHARRLYFIHPIKNEAVICKAAVPQNSFWEEFLEFDEEVNEAIHHG
ncbi:MULTISPECIES: RluA family pseudouridine synthase [unclassified Siphonobacter]|uniref:RluA family pseudouridine synthase n=1 Tax=unclassified Siphonobacter TaxID=2635712 RepID=UPI000CBC944E|nr:MULTISPECIES: RluA family pseudouridine synthase [unclassified Siphonobacter]MDQ1086441.1 23S rRNA pseudouridine1911/1915/1917 synthase [Siphonobacter sp. SORGH_AS_1065]MDR6196711.1 23S rRNA pseudouridine1911/1915/1917 synthase [Siphonobacter sp. SORGH_AS_0500]PKK36120.1 RNA pseudouridine synthase [Siphonobacter sp. SORGH_AS_0500]